MNAFDKVIGYKATKRELLQLCDMLRNREIYEEMGARLPHGLLLYGDPGLGKTLLARCFVEESGLHTITVRRDKGGDAFIDGITQAFASAKTKAPSIVLLDDMDKFANADDGNIVKKVTEGSARDFFDRDHGIFSSLLFSLLIK